jgi:hypothetical protein
MSRYPRQCTARERASSSSSKPLTLKCFFEGKTLVKVGRKAKGEVLCAHNKELGWRLSSKELSPPAHALLRSLSCNNEKNLKSLLLRSSVVCFLATRSFSLLTFPHGEISIKFSTPLPSLHLARAAPRKRGESETKVSTRRKQFFLLN